MPGGTTQTTNFHSVAGRVRAERTGTTGQDYFSDANGSVIATTSPTTEETLYAGRYLNFGAVSAIFTSGTLPILRWGASRPFIPGARQAEFLEVGRPFSASASRWQTESKSLYQATGYVLLRPQSLTSLPICFNEEPPLHPPDLLPMCGRLESGPGFTECDGYTFVTKFVFPGADSRYTTGTVLQQLKYDFQFQSCAGNPLYPPNNCPPKNQMSGTYIEAWPIAPGLTVTDDQFHWGMPAIPTTDTTDAASNCVCGNGCQTGVSGFYQCITPTAVNTPPPGWSVSAQCMTNGLWSWGGSTSGFTPGNLTKSVTFTTDCCRCGEPYSGVASLSANAPLVNGDYTCEPANAKSWSCTDCGNGCGQPCPKAPDETRSNCAGPCPSKTQSKC